MKGCIFRRLRLVCLLLPLLLSACTEAPAPAAEPVVTATPESEPETVVICEVTEVPRTPIPTPTPTPTHTDTITIDEPIGCDLTVSFSDGEQTYTSLFFYEHLNEYD